MILAIDMGNTNIVIGCVDDERIWFVERLATDQSKLALEYAVSIKNVLAFHHIVEEDIEGIIISSVVPPLVHVIREACRKVLGMEPMIIDPGMKTGLNVIMDHPETLGSDLIVNAVAGIHEYGSPAIYIDMGTATTISVVDCEQNYIGGAILPGLATSMNALVSNAAQLSKVSLEAPERVIGKNTAECMKSGLVIASAAGIDGMIDRMWEELGYETLILATGGLASIVIPQCRHDIIIDDGLLLKGLKILYDMNKDG